VLEAFLVKPLQQDLNANAYENGTAQDLGLTFDQPADSATNERSQHREPKRSETYDQGRDPNGDLQNRETQPNGQRINACRHSKHQHIPCAPSLGIVAVVRRLTAMQRLEDHLASNEYEETKRYPGAEIADEAAKGKPSQPSEHGHEHLETSEPVARPDRITYGNVPDPAPVRNGHCKRIHRKGYGNQKDGPETHDTSTTSALLAMASEMQDASNASHISFQKYTGMMPLYKLKHPYKLGSRVWVRSPQRMLTLGTDGREDPYEYVAQVRGTNRCVVPVGICLLGRCPQPSAQTRRHSKQG
jgi:hypothetical protein